MTVWLIASSLYIMLAGLTAGAPPAATAANKEEGGRPDGRAPRRDRAGRGRSGGAGGGRPAPGTASAGVTCAAVCSAARSSETEDGETVRRSWESCRSSGNNRNRVSEESELVR